MVINPTNNKICLLYKELVPSIIAVDNYHYHRKKGSITVHGRGGNGNEVLIEYDTLPVKIKSLVLQAFGDPYKYIAKQPFLEQIERDYVAQVYYENHSLKTASRWAAYAEKYTKAASWLNMIVRLMEDKRELKRTLDVSIAGFWNMVRQMLLEDFTLNPDTKNFLPTSEKFLKEKVKEYKEVGYECLIEKFRFGNNNSKKVNDKIETLICSLYANINKPYIVDVFNQLEDIRLGKSEFVDPDTGEVFDSSIFKKKDRDISIDLATVKYYVNMPVNRAAIDKVRMSHLEYRNTHRPHVHRHAPAFSFSKISMDDISIPFKLHDGKRAWAYQIFDVKSGCVIGHAFGKDKGKDLFTAAVRDMVTKIIINGWGMPSEIEVEQHISNTFKGTENEDDILTEGNIFEFVRWCQGGNPQEKRAEGFIKSKKYTFQNKRDGFQRRPFARLEANRSNEDNKGKITYDYNTVVANETEDIIAHNRSLHPDQTQYPGLSRWDVLTQNMNPNLPAPNVANIAKYIGLESKTTIRRSQFVEVKGIKYALPSVSVMDEFVGIRMKAYYFEINGTIPQVHLYQEDKFICTCECIERFNESRAERTDKDQSIAGRQFQYTEEYDEKIREKIGKFIHVQELKLNNIEPVSQPIESTEEPEAVPVEIITQQPITHKRSMKDLLYRQ